MDAVSVEYLSSIAKTYQHETSLIYDQDLFGTSDNVISSPYFHKLCVNGKKYINKILREKADPVVFINAINGDKRWMNEVLQQIKTNESPPKTVLLSYVDSPGLSSDFDYRLIGEPEVAFEAFLRKELFESNQKKYQFKELADLEALPLPDKTLFDRFVNFSDSYVVFASRGCPYGCSY